jgi:hypothetical protein
VSTFLKSVPRAGKTKSRDWLRALASDQQGPTALLERLQRDLDERNYAAVPHSITLGLAFCLTEPGARDSFPQQVERLPLSRARAEAEARASVPVKEFMRHVIEAWVLAQHAYWSVGRGLADARAGGNKLLRLRVILDEGGWALTPGAVAGKPPRPTPDRLHTAITLAEQCGIFERSRQPR